MCITCVYIYIYICIYTYIYIYICIYVSLPHRTRPPPHCQGSVLRPLPLPACRVEQPLDEGDYEANRPNTNNTTFIRFIINHIQLIQLMLLLKVLLIIIMIIIDWCCPAASRTNMSLKVIAKWLSHNIGLFRARHSTCF